MIEISLNKISKSYGFSPLLKDFSLCLKTKERIALIGENGCGKTTILKIICGKEDIDSGSLNISKSVQIGYLSQINENKKDGVKANDVFLKGVFNLIKLENDINNFISNMTSSEKDIKILNKLQEEFRIKGGYNYKERVGKIKHGFSLSDEMLNREFNCLSGGEKTIVSLASLILSNPNVLLLDEPTNHLDIETLKWFEEYLQNYNGSVIVVSHDRYFLDNVVTKIIEIENQKEEVYNGNYSYYLKESEKRLLLKYSNYKNQQKEINAMHEAIKRLKEWGNKSDNPIFFTRAANIEKRLERLEIVTKPKQKRDLNINLNIDNRSSNEVLKIRNLNLSINNKELLENVNLDVNYKDRMCLMGKNGCGKTTLIKKILKNEHENIKIGANIKIGYIPQEIKFDNENMTIYEYIKQHFTGDEEKCRNKLNQFYFSKNTIDKKLKEISGGEKVRIKLLELILLKANFLLLDEPTNHIDIRTKEILEEALLDYKGTILFISHDRYFINKIATKVAIITDKKIKVTLGNYNDIKIDKKQENKEIKVQEQITIKGSNRLNEFLKDTKIRQLKKGKINIYQIKKKSKNYILKIANHLSEESIKIDYLSKKLNIAEKIFYEKYNNKSYMLLNDFKIKSLLNEQYKNNKEELFNIIQKAFNEIYNIDYSDLIIDQTIDIKIKNIEQNINNINLSKENIKRFITKENIIKYLKGNKPKQIIGFTLGKMNLENIFVDQNNNIYFKDVSNMGIGDIYYDIVNFEISLENNFNKDYVYEFYKLLGFDYNEEKSNYYKLLISIEIDIDL